MITVAEVARFERAPPWAHHTPRTLREATKAELPCERDWCAVQPSKEDIRVCGGKACPSGFERNTRIVWGDRPMSDSDAGRQKRARTEDSKPDSLTVEEYIKELTAEQESIDAAKYPHAARLLLAEVESMSKAKEEQEEGGQPSADGTTQASAKQDGGELPWEKQADETGIKCVLMPDAQGSQGNTKCSMKIFLPENTPDGRQSATRGRLLGPQGATLRALEAETRCKMCLKGRGSIKARDPTSHDQMLQDPSYAHLNEDLHVLVEYEGTAQGRNIAFSAAEALVRTVLNGGTVEPSG
eukprot:CAMPEP_0172063698 /NCGR_PEP_ID=MMETSP1043-20130122/9713_1 /TAXON_ID=464988 /ORGANISM="Hemiselmis andersenii, Strain CCMP441" /LENGTH=297 /DNA_ID=CAMNT_0012723701 /DNA_START=348 /DNA_END=1237 /DNA_ORIENTATION=+